MSNPSFVDQMKVVWTVINRTGFVILLFFLMMAFVVSSSKKTMPPIPDLTIRKAEFDSVVQEQIETVLEKLKIDPNNKNHNGELGMILHAHYLYKLSEPLYIRARILEPNSFRWAYYLGIIRAPLGKLDEAEISLRQAVDLKSNYLPAQLALAETLQKLRKLRESRQVYEQILKKYPQSASAYAGLGRVCWEEGKVSEAIKNYQKACDLFPEFGAAHYALGLAHRNLKNEEKTQEHFSKFQRYSSREPLAEDPFLDAIKKLGVRTEHILREAFALREQGQFKKAATTFEKVLQLEHDHAVAHGNLLSLYIALRNPLKVEKHYRAAVEINPNMYKTHRNFGLFLARAGRTTEAIETFRKVLALNPFDSKTHNNLGYLLVHQGKSVEAETHFLLAIQYEPNFQLPHFNLGRLMITQGENKKAIQHLQKTLIPEDESVPLHIYTLAVAYVQLGDTTKAREYLLHAKSKAVGPAQKPVLASILELLTHLDTMKSSVGQ